MIKIREISRLCKNKVRLVLKYYQKMCLKIIFLIIIYKQDLVINKLQWLVYHKTLSKTKPYSTELVMCFSLICVFTRLIVMQGVI